MTTDSIAPDALTLHTRNLRLGVRLLNAVVFFYFLGFLFAYIYLKTLDSNGLWRAKHDDPSIAFGTAIAITAVAAAVVYAAGRRSQSGEAAWVPATPAALVLTLASAVLTVVELLHPGFANGGSGFASVFVGWMWSYVVLLLGVCYWTVTLITGERSATVATPANPTAGPAPTPATAADTSAATGLRTFLVFVAVLAIVQYVLLYLVR